MFYTHSSRDNNDNNSTIYYNVLQEKEIYHQNRMICLGLLMPCCDCVSNMDGLYLDDHISWNHFSSKLVIALSMVKQSSKENHFHFSVFHLIF